MTVRTAAFSLARVRRAGVKVRVRVGQFRTPAAPEPRDERVGVVHSRVIAFQSPGGGAFPRPAFELCLCTLHAFKGVHASVGIALRRNGGAWLHGLQRLLRLLTPWEV